MIRFLTPSDIPRIAKIHKDELSGFLPELGLEFLCEFYKAGIKLPEVFTLVDEENGIVRGFCCCITEASGLYKRIILKNPGKFVLLFLGYFLTHPANIPKIFRILAYPGFSEGGPELLSIAVSRDYQRRGIGGKLFAGCNTEFKRRGIKSFKISVYDRLSANTFYRKTGCKLVRSFDFLGEKMNYYEYKNK